jgi:hypothetical protein
MVSIDQRLACSAVCSFFVGIHLLSSPSERLTSRGSLLERSNHLSTLTPEESLLSLGDCLVGRESNPGAFWSWRVGSNALAVWSAGTESPCFRVTERCAGGLRGWKLRSTGRFILENGQSLARRLCLQVLLESWNHCNSLQLGSMKNSWTVIAHELAKAPVCPSYIYPPVPSRLSAHQVYWGQVRRTRLVVPLRGSNTG